MTEAELIGTWGCYRSLVYGEKEKVYSKPKVTMKFEEGGKGKLKLFVVPLQFKWNLTDGVLKILNISNGTELPVEMTEDGFAMLAENNSKSYFTKM